MPTRGYTHPGSGRTSTFDPLLSSAYPQGLWVDCPLAEYRHDPSIGILLDDPCVSYNAQATTGDWVGTAATSGTAATHTTIPGAILLDAGATTDNQGMQIQRTKAGFIPAAGKDIWFEARVLLTATTPPVTRAQVFIGMCAADTTIIASGAMSTNDHIGWNILDGELLVSKFSCDKAATTNRATGHTFVAATVVRLGFKYDGTADTVQQYINGVATGSAQVTANIPKNVIYPAFVCQSDGTDRPNMALMGLRVFQLR